MLSGGLSLLPDPPLTHEKRQSQQSRLDHVGFLDSQVKRIEVDSQVFKFTLPCVFHGPPGRGHALPRFRCKRHTHPPRRPCSTDSPQGSGSQSRNERMETSVGFDELIPKALARQDLTLVS